MKCQILDNCKEEITKDNELNHSISHLFDCLKGIVDNQIHVIKRDSERNEILQEILKELQAAGRNPVGDTGLYTRTN